MKKEELICPQCGSTTDIYLVAVNQKIGTALGGGIGGIIGWFGKKSARKTLAVIGAKLCSVLPKMGRTGGMIGALTGFFTGAAIGNCLGEFLDEHVVCKYKCGKCGEIFFK